MIDKTWPLADLFSSSLFGSVVRTGKLDRVNERERERERERKSVQES